MSDIWKTLKIEGRENDCGQKAECLVCTKFELPLDTSRINSNIIGGETPYQAKLTFAIFQGRGSV